MEQNDIYEAQKRLIEGENVNISETNVLRDFFQIVLKLILILVVVYASFMFISGIIVNLLSVKQQVKFENYMTRFVNIEADKLVSVEDARVFKIKNKILKYDKKFPKTSNLDIKIYKNDDDNAFCLPNGNIYITSSLYEKIKNDNEMLTFILAHEMAHYKNKDHIMNFRKSIATLVIALLVTASTSDEKVATIISDTMDLSDLGYSRSVEARADNYAGKILLAEYGSVRGGIKTLELLSHKEYPAILSVFSTHPTIKQRIKNLKRLN